MSKTILGIVGLVIAVVVVGGIMINGGDEAGTMVSPTASAVATTSTTVFASAIPSPTATSSPKKTASPIATSTPTKLATPSPTPTHAPTPTATPSPITILTTINYTDAGYSPSLVTIEKGSTVKFVNMSTKEMWPASAQHPSHNAYPEAGGCLGSMFDACARLKTGESWTFKFNQVGAWGFHDHITPNFFGKITVQ